MNKFEIGDRVRSENTGYSGMSEMTEGIVVRTPYSGSNLYEVKILSGIFRDESSKETCTKCSSWVFTEYELEPFSFKVGDEVEVINPDTISIKNGWKKGDRFIISGIMKDWFAKKDLICGKENYNGIYETELKLIKGGSTMCEKSLRDRIEALPGWTKEADDILDEMGNIYMIKFYEKDKYLEVWTDPNGNDIETFKWISQCSKLRAFKDALLWLLDKSGLEKVDKEKDELLKQIADLKSSHEQEGRRIEELERKANA
jgi:hypothetical protein